MACHVLGGHINLQRGYTGASSLMEYLAVQLQTVPHLNPPGGNSLDYSNGDESSASIPNSFLICLQEPPANRHGVKGLGTKNHLLFQAGGERPRAAIFASANLSLWKLPNFTDEDVVTALWNNN